MFKLMRPFLGLLIAVFLLAACDDAEERAEAHFQRGLALAAEGDVDRALVELRNVFQLNSTHRDARWTYAELLEGQGDIRGAVGHLLRLVEQYPEDTEARVALTRLTVEAGAWDEVQRQYQAALPLAPDAPHVQVAGLFLAYRAAVEANDMSEARAIGRQSKALLAQIPDLFHLRRLLVDVHVRDGELSAALAETEAALALRPEVRQLHEIKLGILTQLDQDEAVEAQLLEMVRIFADDPGIHVALVRWYIGRNQAPLAEAYLRQRVVDEGGTNEVYLTLVAFINDTQGLEAAGAEVERILATPGTDTAYFQATLAGINFELGARQEAITALRALLASLSVGEVSQENVHRFKTTLATMLIAEGQTEEAKVLVNEVLEEDPTEVTALKRKASWLIDEDQVGDAIIELRRALDQSPDDAEIHTLLAQAYERAGNRDLMIEMLALAVEASNSAPAETMRYARTLFADGDYLVAEGALIDSLRRAPETVDVLNLLGNVYLRLESWSQAQQVIGALERVDDPVALTASQELRARLLAAQNRQAELASYLDTLVADGQLQAGAAIIRLRLAQGDTKGAVAYAEELLSADPDNPDLRFLEALVLTADGNIDAAKSRLRGLLDELPEADNIWMVLYNLHRSLGEVVEANAVLEGALEQVPDSPTVRWAHATKLEFDGDAEGAIDVYEALYDEDSSSLVFANNLASLMSVHRADPESLQRAYNIARRLRGTQVPAFQDTYGWIAHRLGNHREALTYLEPAAAGLPEDPLVRFHLGSVYAALGRLEEARSEMQAALTLIDEVGFRRQARPRIAQALAALPEAPAVTETQETPPVDN